MNIESGTITILRINSIMDSHSLDPIRVTLDDIEPGKGRINIECWGRAWASYWGAMGKDNTLAQFFVSCDNDYLIRNLAENMRPTRYSGEALARFTRKTICLRRRFRDSRTMVDYDSLGRKGARELFDAAGDLDSCDTPQSCWNHSELLAQVFGEEWFCSLGSESEEPNPDYGYLVRICNAVREALRQQMKVERAMKLAGSIR
jgi:hypothetical protein